jgi:hypothetical protein
VHQVGHAEDPLCGDVEAVQEVRVGAGRGRLRDRLVVVDVEREPNGDAPRVCVEKRARDQLRRVLLQVEVVEREIEGRARLCEEAGRELGDLERGLASVRQGADVDVRRSRGP